MDGLKRLDKERFKQGETASLHVAHYKSLGTDGKRELSKQLRTDKDTYMAYMHAFESKQKEEVERTSTNKGWRTRWEIAKIEAIDGLPDVQRESMLDDICADLPNRLHETESFRKQNIYQYWF